MRIFKNSKSSPNGSAHWQDINSFCQMYAYPKGKKKVSEPKKESLQPGNMVLSKNVYYNMYTHDTWRDNNVLLIGSSGDCTDRFIVPNIFREKSSFVILDKGGDIYNKTVGKLISDGYDISIFDPFGILKNARAVGYDPLSYVLSDDNAELIGGIIAENGLENRSADKRASAAGCIRNAILRLKDSGAPIDSWPDSLHQYLMSGSDADREAASALDCLLAGSLKGLNREDGLKLKDISSYNHALYVILPVTCGSASDDKAVRMLTALIVMQLGAITLNIQAKRMELHYVQCGRHIPFMFERPDGIDDDEYARSCAEALNTMRGAYIKADRAADGQVVVDNCIGGTVKFSHIQAAKRWIQDVCDGSIVSRKNGYKPANTNIICSDYSQLGYIPHFMEFLVVSRQGGMYFTFSVRTIEHVKNSYPSEFEILIHNCAIHIFMGTENMEDAEWVSMHLGTTAEVVRKTDSYREIKRVRKISEFMPPHMLLYEFPEDECIIMVEGVKPIRDKKLDVIVPDNHGLPLYSYGSDKDIRDALLKRYRELSDRWSCCSDSISRLIAEYEVNKDKGESAPEEPENKSDGKGLFPIDRKFLDDQPIILPSGCKSAYSHFCDEPTKTILSMGCIRMTSDPPKTEYWLESRIRFALTGIKGETSYICDNKNCRFHPDYQDGRK